MTRTAAGCSRLAGVPCLAPHLIDAEVGSVLRRLVVRRMLGAEQGGAALRGTTTLVDHRFPHGPLAPAAWALRDNVGYYDALYIALAERLDLTLLTADAKLAHAPRLPCAVELISPPPA